MYDAEYLADRAQQEIRAASLAFDVRARTIHLQLADAYTFRLQQLNRLKRRPA